MPGSFLGIRVAASGAYFRSGIAATSYACARGTASPTRYENINAPELGEYGVDHVKVVEGFGCKAIRVFKPEDIQPAFARAKEWLKEFQVPIVVELILERVTNIAMGTEINAITEFEEVVDLPPEIGIETENVLA